MTIIKNKEDWKKFYSYDKKYLKKYPKEYPCIAKKEDEHCGIMGDAWFHYVIYLPKNIEAMSKEEIFLAGTKAEWKHIC